MKTWLAALLSVIAGMVDVTGFLTLGNLFTAHVTGNIVVIAALFVRGGRINPGQVLAVPVFVIAVAMTWLVARASGRRGADVLRPLLRVHFILIACLLGFSVIVRPSVDPHGTLATIAAMIAVTAMACQFALLRLALPVAPSTAVMTGNLTNAVLGLMENDRGRFLGALHLLAGFFVGCVAAAAVVTSLRDWTWSLPAALAFLAVISPGIRSVERING